MVVGLAADGDVSLPDLDLADGPLVRRRRLRGQGPRRAWSPRPATCWSRSRWPTSSSPSTPASPRGRPLRRRAGARLSRERSGRGGAADGRSRSAYAAVRSAAACAVAPGCVAASRGVGCVLPQQQPRPSCWRATTPCCGPTLDGYVVLHTGPVLPDVRGPPAAGSASTSRSARPSADLGRRARRALRLHRQPARGPDRQGRARRSATWRSPRLARRARRAGAARDLVAASARRRRGELRRAHAAHAAAARGRRSLLALAACSWWQPWKGDEPARRGRRTGCRSATFLGPEVPLPDERGRRRGAAAT